MELLGTGMTGILGSLECTPGYYNNEGQPGVGWELLRGYPLRRHG